MKGISLFSNQLETETQALLFNNTRGVGQPDVFNLHLLCVTMMEGNRRHARDTNLGNTSAMRWRWAASENSAPAWRVGRKSSFPDDGSRIIHGISLSSHRVVRVFHTSQEKHKGLGMF